MACAGPILAAVLVQIIRQESDIQALLLIGVFALGAGVTMLIIVLTGRKIMTKLSFFTTHAEAVQKTFGVIILVVGRKLKSNRPLFFYHQDTVI